MKTLILGYGNTLRGDDGLGAYAAQALASAGLPEGIEVQICHQLTPEHAALLAQFERAIFIDAALGQAGDIPGEIHARMLQPVVLEVSGLRPASITHHFDPEMLLALAHTLYGHAPQAVLYSLTATSFELKEGLSPQVAQALPRLVAQVQASLQVTLAPS